MKFSLTKVISILYNKAISIEATRLSGGARGSPAWIGKYSKAHSNIRKDLTEEERDKAIEKKEEMDNGDIPREVQGR